MIPWKLLGGVLIIASGLAASLLGMRRERRKLRVLEAWIDLLSHVRNQIDCYLKPLDEILAKIDVSDFGDPSKSPVTLSSLLASTQNDLGEEEKKLLTSLIREFGGSHREDQLKQCDYYIDQLRNRRQRRAEELTPRIRVTTAICLCASLGAAILLW